MSATMASCSQASGAVRFSPLPERRTRCTTTTALRVPGYSRRSEATRTVCRAQQEDKVGFWQSAGQKAATAAAAGILTFSSVAPMAIANEFDILNEDIPSKEFVIDDAGALSKSGKKALTNLLKTLEIKSGYRVTAITTRKLEFETDAFAFADKVLEGWYPTREIGDKKGIVLIITTSKDGAVTGGPSFMSATSWNCKAEHFAADALRQAVGDDLIDSIIGDNIPILTEEELYNEAMISTAKRIDAKLTGEEDPGPPARKDTSRKRTYKTKAETDRTKGVTSTVVISLLVIAFVVPMLQFYGYVAKD